MSAVVFAGLVAVVPLSAAPYGSVEPLWTALFEALVFLLAVLWAVEGAVSGRWVSRAHSLALPGLALVAYALLQSVPLGGGETVSYDPYQTRLFALKLLAYTTFLALLLRYTDTERRLRVLVYSVVSAGLASALFGIVRRVVQRGQEGLLLEYLRPDVGFAQFINRNHFGYLAEMTLGLLLGLIAGRGVPRGKLLIPLALALPVWAGLVLSNSRGGVLAMLCQFIFIGATFGATRAAVRAPTGSEPSFNDRLLRSRAVRTALTVVLLATIVVGMAWLGGDSLADRFARVDEEVAAESAKPSRTMRKDIWAATARMFAEQPITGVGFGGYWIAYSRYHEGSGGFVAQEAHNDYLELLASGGVIGAALVALFAFLLVRQSLPRLRSGSPFERAACLGALTGLCGVCVHSLGEFGLHVPSNAFAALALVAAATARPGSS
jgi:O-antigen ligase